MHKKTIHIKQVDVLWNTLGMTASAFSSLLLVLGTTRIVGADQGGIFSIAFTTAQQLMMLGNYGLRTYQVSDISNRYNPRDYLNNRILTCAAMLFFGFIYCCLRHFDIEKSIVVMLVIFAKMLDAFADVFEGRLQQCGHLAVAGRSMTIRMGTTTIAFLLTLLLTKQLITACVAMVIVAILTTQSTAVIPQNRLCPSSSPSTGFRNAVALLFPSFPLFFSAFGLMYIANTPKYAIDALMTSTDQSVFTTLYMPAMAVSLLSSFAFRPLITHMAEEWNGADYLSVGKIVYHFFAYILIALILILISFYFIGIPLLNLLSGLVLDAYLPELMLVITGGALSAVSALLLQALTVMRQQKYIFLAYFAAMLFSTAISTVLVRRAGLMGASVAYLVQMFFLVGTLYTIFRLCIHQRRLAK